MDLSLIVILSTPIFILLYAFYVIVHELLLRRRDKNEIKKDPKLLELEEELKKIKNRMF